MGWEEKEENAEGTPNCGVPSQAFQIILHPRLREGVLEACQYTQGSGKGQNSNSLCKLTPERYQLQIFISDCGMEGLGYS